jgi:CheY-like chemotaxis protein/Tfp pilus assembly protein PilZ
MAAESRPTPPTSHGFNGAERRRFPRFNMALDVAFGPACRRPATADRAGRPTGSGTRPTESKLERTVTVNLSIGGLCLYSDVLYPIGSELFCSLSLPGREKPIEVVGTVAWFQKVNHEAHGYKMGLEFTDVSAQDRAALRALLEHPPAVEPSRSKRLLLVDDDQELCQALKLRFEAGGFEVITAGDGLEGLRKGREEHPDLVILDLMLPKLNGYEVCRLLKFDQKFRHIPIILCTARSRREDRLMGETVGADAYVTKPFDGKALLAKADELVAQHP